ncbi:hypothetical protein FRC12_008873 [Ceratobasidium sp. 428]|nr:hypothetical protein FRC12_008873 [Ceratobasidium sp. 428]
MSDEAVFILAHSIDQNQDTHELFQSILQYFRTPNTGQFLVRLDQAIALLERGITFIPDEHTNRPAIIGRLGDLYSTRFSNLGNRDDIDSAIIYHERAGNAASDIGDKAEWLNNLGDSYHRRFDQLGQSGDIDSAVERKRQAASLLTDDHLDKPSWLNNLGNSLQRRFGRFGNIDDINEAIRNQALAVLLTPDEDTDKVDHMINLAKAHQARFDYLGGTEDIDTAINIQTEAVSRTSSSSPADPRHAATLGRSYIARFEYLGVYSDLEQGIAYQQQAVDHAPDKSIVRFATLCDLSKAYRLRFESSMGEIGDIEKSFGYLTDAESCIPGESAELKLLLFNGRSTSFHSRFERNGSLKDLEDSISLQEMAFSYISDNDTNRSRYFNHLGTLRFRRFEYLGELHDLETAISHYNHAASLIPERHADRPKLLCSLGNAYVIRFKHMSRVGDIEDAITYHTQAVEITPQNHPDKRVYLGNLGGAYGSRFEQLDQTKDLDNSIGCLEEAVLLGSKESIQSHLWLSNLGTAYQKRFSRLGDLADVEKAIHYHTQSVSQAPEDHTIRPHYLASLGDSFRSRFSRQGQLSDIDSAITSQTQAVSSARADNVDLPDLLYNLGLSHRNRYSYLGILTDLDKAIGLQDRAVLITSQDFPERPLFLTGLGNAYHDRFERLGTFSDIERAIACQTEAASLVRETDPREFMVLINLGNAYHARYNHTNHLGDVEAAIYNHSQALSCIPAQHPDQYALLSNLASSHEKRFMHLEKQSDLEKAISLGKEAVALIPLTHARRPLVLNELGDSYLVQYRRTGDSDVLMLSVDCFKRSAQSLSGTPSHKFRGARMWATLSYEHGIPSAIVAFKQVMLLLPQAVWLGSTVQNRFENASSLGDLVMSAAAAAIGESRYDLALEWLEEGRSIVWQQMLRLRTPLEELRSVHATLADQLERVGFLLARNGLAQPAEFSTVTSEISVEQSAQEHRRLAEEWEQLIEKIRKVDGFQNFLRPRSKLELSQAARNHPVVVVNVHTSRCDALALLPNASVIHIPLPSFSYEKALMVQEQIFRSLSYTGVRSRNERRPTYPTLDKSNDLFKDALAVLWCDVAKFVLSRLGYLQSNPLSPLPHITWCATGPLAFLPLHAAGCYDTTDARTFKFVISSYTPTLGALLGERKATGHFDGILGVGQSATANQSALPGTVTELDNLQRLAGSIQFTRLDEQHATPNNVPDNMGTHAWVHLACHATQDRTDPVKSAFCLHGGQLDLATIAQRPLKCATFAFLSACETALGDEKVPEEAVHLAAGMMFAGYSSVIATMWSIHDDDAPLITEKVYQCLLEDSVPNSERAGEALHYATQSLRAQVKEEAFGRWVPYIHIGH